MGKDVSLSWDPVTKRLNSTPVILGGYKISYGTTSKIYTGMRDVKNVTLYKISFSTFGPQFFSVRCYDSDGILSDFSNEVEAVLTDPTKVSNPMTPANLAITSP